jgi:hypothetical protein
MSEKVTVHNGHHVSTIVVKSDDHVKVVHVYHPPQTEDKENDSDK